MIFLKNIFRGLACTKKLPTAICAEFWQNWILANFARIRPANVNLNLKIRIYIPEYLSKGIKIYIKKIHKIYEARVNI
jgi:hypothetical protein